MMTTRVRAAAMAALFLVAGRHELAAQQVVQRPPARKVDSIAVQPLRSTGSAPSSTAAAAAPAAASVAAATIPTQRPTPARAAAPTVPAAQVTSGETLLVPDSVPAPRLRAQAAQAASVAPVAAESRAPDGATMRCKDGTYLSGAPSEAACSDRGGLAAALTPARATPPAPRRP